MITPVFQTDELKQQSFKRAVLTVLLLLNIGFVPSLYAESNSDYKKRPLDVRVERLERLMSSQKQLELLYRMKQLQKENQQLRSLLEEQSNEIHLLKQQQRELYSDLNRRLGQMEKSDVKGADATLNPINHQPVELQGGTAQDIVHMKASNKPKENKSMHAPSSGKKAVVVSTPVPAARTPVIRKPMSVKQQKAEQKAYQKAYDELRALRYNKARDSFSEFIQKYPTGRYAHIAQYWIAESSYVQRNFEQAVTDYQLLLDVYPFSPKKAEAHLKKAYSYYEMGEKEKSRQTLNDLLRAYPGTTEAGQAKRLLKKL